MAIARARSPAREARALPESTITFREMVPTTSTKWLSRFVWFTAVATLFLICSGGMVTSKGVGLAVPDWPTTFGYNMFLFPVSKWVGGIFVEHTHRLIASTVGFLTIILAFWLWRRENRPWVRNLGFIALGAVILQGILGGLRVTMLKDEIGIFHACLAQAFLGLLVFIGLVTTAIWQKLPNAVVARRNFNLVKSIVFMTTGAIYLQLALGATMRHQHRDLAILDFPTANGAWIPDTSEKALVAINTWRDTRGFSDVTAFQIWLQMAHRFGALLVSLGVIAVCYLVRRNARQIAVLNRLSILWVVFLFIQLTLGGWTIWSNKAADIATAHVAVGAAMLCFGVSISAICWRILQSSWHGLSARESSEHTGSPRDESVRLADKMPVPQAGPP
jgi:heme a synthase